MLAYRVVEQLFVGTKCSFKYALSGWVLDDCNIYALSGLNMILQTRCI